MATVEKIFRLPKETLDAFDQKVERERQGELLASLIEKWLAEQPSASQREQFIRGILDMEDISLELERAFHPLEEEVHRALLCESQRV